MTTAQPAYITDGLDREDRANHPIICDHEPIGTVSAGDSSKLVLPAYTVTVCAECVSRAQTYAEWYTGHPAQELLTFEEARSKPIEEFRHVLDVEFRCGFIPREQHD